MKQGPEMERNILVQGQEQGVIQALQKITMSSCRMSPWRSFAIHMTQTMRTTNWSQTSCQRIGLIEEQLKIRFEFTWQCAFRVLATPGFTSICFHLPGSRPTWNAPCCTSTVKTIWRSGRNWTKRREAWISWMQHQLNKKIRARRQKSDEDNNKRIDIQEWYDGTASEWSIEGGGGRRIEGTRQQQTWEKSKSQEEQAKNK